MRSELQGHQVVCSAFIEKNQKVLILMDPKFKVWRVPGGRPEHGEKLEYTLIREMEEETGVKFENPEFVGWGQDQQFKVDDQLETSRLIMFFHVQFDHDHELKLDPAEAEDHKWVTIDELKCIENKEGALFDFFQRYPDFDIAK